MVKGNKLVTQVPFVVRTQEKLPGPLATLGNEGRICWKTVDFRDKQRNWCCPSRKGGHRKSESLYAFQITSVTGGDQWQKNGSFLGSAIDFPSVASLLSFVNSNQKLGRLEQQEANKIDYETGHLKQQFVWWSGKGVIHFDVATACLEVTQSRKYFRGGYIPWN